LVERKSGGVEEEWRRSEGGVERVEKRSGGMEESC